MTYAQLVQLYFDRSNALQWYWTLYVVIIGGLLAFASLRKQPDRLTTLLVSVLFCLFAYKNLGAIGDVTAQRAAILDAAKLVQPGIPDAITSLLTPTLINPDFAGIRSFHILCDILTVAAIWAMELRRRRAATAAQ
jgi:hypothetical protein